MLSKPFEKAVYTVVLEIDWKLDRYKIKTYLF